MKSYAIIGMGLFGTALAKDLYNKGHYVLAIDINEERIENVADSVSQAVILDATKTEALEKIGISKYDTVVVALSSELATSVIITMRLKSFNVPTIICKVKDENDISVLESLGADMCIIPEHIAAKKLSLQIDTGNINDYIQLTENYSIMEITIPDNWVGKSIKDLAVRAQYGINIIGIKRNGTMSVDFSPMDALSAEDELVVVGSDDNLKKITKIK